MNSSSGIRISSNFRRGVSKAQIVQSLPMAVPVFNQRSDDDYEEVSGVICSLFLFHIPFYQNSSVFFVPAF